jgi:hypothetical protein
VRKLLTPALAGLNPKAYTAHFRRLDPDGQRQYLSELQVDDLKLHFRAVGENATVGLFLTVDAESFRLEATVGGAALSEGAGPVDLQARALSVGTFIGAKVVSGMLVTSLKLLPATELALKALRWEPRTLILAGDSGGKDAPPSLGWAIRGAIADVGTFYMPNEALAWAERATVEAKLRELAGRTGAVLDVRLGSDAH